MVSVIILSYNTKELLRLCLTSVFNKLSGNTFEVIVVDNASKDASTAMVKKNFSKARLVENKENMGFAKGCNIGASIALGEYLLFLNSDTQVVDIVIRDMLELFQKDKNLAVIGGQLENANGVTSDSYGVFYSISSVVAMLFGRRLAKPAMKESKIVDWVSGGFMIVRKSIFKELQGFDEHFFMYVEDMELCFRVKKRGQKVLFFPQAKALHTAQGSSSRSFAIIHIYKGLLYFFKKHKPYWEYCIVKLLLTLKAVTAICIGLLTFNRELVVTYRKALVISI